MLRLRIALPAIIALFIAQHVALPFALSSQIYPYLPSQMSAVPTTPAIKLLKVRQSAADLEVGGELAGVPPGETRYVSWAELHSLPQVSYTVSDDSNFIGPTKIEGVMLDALAKTFGAAPESDLVVAICDDQYRANYTSGYIAAHHPLLVLEVNDEAPDGWPKDSDSHQQDMGPYMISHPNFTPNSQTAADADEPQIPWGVVRIEFRDEKTVFGAIAPHGSQAQDGVVQTGFHIAEQNCFRCHNMGNEGGKKSGVPWVALSQIASASPELFTKYVRNPVAVYPKAQMPGNPKYDDAMLKAITAYFQTFSPAKTQ